MAGIPQQPVPKAKTNLGPWVGIGVIILALAVVAAIYLVVNRTNDNGNTNNAVAQTNGSTNVNGILSNSTNNANANVPFVDIAPITYRNSAFGYSVRYTSLAGSEPTTWSSNNIPENLYDEWGMGRGTEQVIAIQVYPKDKKGEVFTARNFEALEDTEALNLNITANFLKVDGELRGYTFDRGNYTFVLFSGGTLDSPLYNEFKTIAQTLYF